MPARLRLIIPPTFSIVAFVALFAVFEGWVMYFEWQAWPARLELPFRPGPLLLRFAAVFYGLFRVVGFHPLHNAPYCEWLERSPWTSRKPLPVGPVAIVVEDSVVVGLLTALAATQVGFHPSRIVTLALASYASVLTISLWRTGCWAFAYSVAFAVGLVVRLWPHPWICLAAAAATGLLSQVGLARSLARFPWPRKSLRAMATPAGTFGASTGLEAEPSLEFPCGWPYDALRPRPVFHAIDLRDALLIGILVGWWVSAIDAHIVSDDARRLFLWLSVLNTVIWSVIFRLRVYLGNQFSAPISLLGRLGTFRWVIPGFDRVFLTPLCVVIWGGVVPLILRPYGLRIWAPTTIAGAIAIVLGGGPTLKNWQLTGKHRIQPRPTGGVQPDIFVRVG
jgi:hypothetical protein